MTESAHHIGGYGNRNLAFLQTNPNPKLEKFTFIKQNASQN